jgi:hypothetical protein
VPKVWERKLLSQYLKKEKTLYVLKRAWVMERLNVMVIVFQVQLVKELAFIVEQGWY